MSGMKVSKSWFKTSDGTELLVRTCTAEGVEPKAVLQVHHGMAEHGGRYERFAETAVQQGYIVIVHDVRAHGETAEKANLAPGIVKFDSCFRLVEDLKELVKESRTTYPDIPLFVLGHSLGSMISQLATGAGGGGIPVDGLVLSGPPARSKAVEIAALRAVAASISLAQGGEAFSSIPDKLTFQKYQGNLLKKAGIKASTGFEWLSRDPEETKKYEEDKFCGHLMSNGFWKAFIPVISALNTHAAVPPANTPVLLIQGESDTCGITDFGTYSSKQIEQLYDSAPLRRVAPKVITYGGARHELLNEINRDEVTADILAFLKTCRRSTSKL